MRTRSAVAALAAALALAGCAGDEADPVGDAVDPPTPDPVVTEPTVVATPPADEGEAAPDPGTADAPEEQGGFADADPDADPGPGAAEVVQGDGFTITFPTPPSVETVEVPLDEGLSTEATIYQSQVDGAFLGFSHADTPDTGEELQFDPEQALRDSAQGAADNTGGEVTEAEIITFLDRTAIDYVVTVPGGVLRGIAFFDDTRLYTGQLVGEGESLDRQPLDELMGSLELG